MAAAHAPGAARATEEDVAAVAPVDLAQVEADAYWCLSKLLDQIQDHYTFAQRGIQRMVFKLKELVARIDAPLHAHLAYQGLHFIQFAFRWMNWITFDIFDIYPPQCVGSFLSRLLTTTLLPVCVVVVVLGLSLICLLYTSDAADE